MYGIHSVFTYCKIEGIGNFLALCFQFCLRIFFYKTQANLLTFDLSKHISFSTDRVPLQIELLAENRIQELSQITLYDEGEIRRRLQEGQFCILGIVDSKIAHYSWVTGKPQVAGEIESVFRFKIGHFYLYNCRTLKKFRGLHIFPAVISRALAEAKLRGAVRLRALVASNNQASLQAFEKFHFMTEREFKVTRILFWYFGNHQKSYEV